MERAVMKIYETTPKEVGCNLKNRQTFALSLSNRVEAAVL